MKTITKNLVLGLLLLSASPALAQTNIKSFRMTSKTVKQFEKAEWNIEVEASFSNPFLQEDIAVDMMLTSPSGKKLVLPCYFESSGRVQGAMWKSRFLPQEKGKYNYYFQLRKDGKEIESRQATFVALKSNGKGILHLRDNWTFKFDNGAPFRGIGENICWESRAEDDSKFFKELHEKEKYNYEYLLPRLVKNGGNYFRTWICSWNLPLDWKNGINNHRYQNSEEYFNPSAVRKMDRLVNLSDSLGLFMMLTLGQGTHDAKHGRYAVSTPEFFVNEQAKAQYKNRLRFIVARWGYSPAIGAWEFFNEIDNVQFRNAGNPIPAQHIVQWHDEMSTYLKQIDPYQHLVTTSISHRDLEGLNSLKNIDFNQKHIYKNNRALPTTIVKYSEEFKKPYVIGEYGYEYDWSKNFNLFGDEMDSDFKRGLWYGLFSPTPILPLSWWWEFFEDRRTDTYIKRVRAIQDQMLAAGNGSFKTLSASSETPRVEVYAVKCGAKTFVYVYNPANTAVNPVINVDGTNTVKAIKVYDCESGKYTDVKLTSSSNGLQIKNMELSPNSDKVFIF
ncbi:DUF5060 domain-containing protein [Pedobacter ginsengisoli]|uniref:DUF5060 domain-containing protein n=1 Tax=Pedobacter ginsengisoli TaxID=363852 RepID=UPI00254C6A04|nr:DUF5060 domain-containing protein [Pedobacter ginsengisoli]